MKNIAKGGEEHQNWNDIGTQEQKEYAAEGLMLVGLKWQSIYADGQGRHGNDAQASVEYVVRKVISR